MTAVYVAIESFCADVAGTPTVVHKGVTRVREGHVLLATYPMFFQPADEGVHYDVEDAAAEPGRKRGDK